MAFIAKYQNHNEFNEYSHLSTSTLFNPHKTHSSFNINRIHHRLHNHTTLIIYLVEIKPKYQEITHCKRCKNLWRRVSLCSSWYKASKSSPDCFSSLSTTKNHLFSFISLSSFTYTIPLLSSPQIAISFFIIVFSSSPSPILHRIWISFLETYIRELTFHIWKLLVSRQKKRMQ